MSALAEMIEKSMAAVLNEAWDIRNGTVVPATDSVALKNGAVKIEAAYLYADLADSTLLQKAYKPEFAAKVIRMYLRGACDIIRDCGGSIKSFDGDRVMGVFIGDSKRTDAADAALKINWLVAKAINPLLQAHRSDTGSYWILEHGIGIDVGPAFIVRAGVNNRSGEHNHNDLISVGEAPNIAAKLSGLRGAEAGPLVITEAVYSRLADSSKFGGTDNKNMWSGPHTTLAGPHTVKVYKSTWRRTA
ncbi:adenylate/guanylate cyclase domain-containing protein [Rathayibacter soli]|uniref:adenylate/guanylate cyclase domain-containing protein n=1 Tax=Rathayibacter soli TaxID=3144168 RepID=UPI0027E4244A|nr:adenylate/guanylate cyclase domain-containing protein [Glaciibacter superstes]